MERLPAGGKIYFAFYEAKKALLYYNQLKERTGLSDSSAQNALRKLKANREIEAIVEKANTFYRLKDKNRTKVWFTLFDYGRLENLNPDVKVPVKGFLAGKPAAVQFIILFGSASRKEEKKGSDIDILVVLHTFSSKRLQKEYETEIKAAFERLREKINATSIYPISIFYIDINSYLAGNDRVVAEARQTGFCIGGHMSYYEAMLDESAG